MTGKPVFAASEREKVLFPDPAMPVTSTRRPIRKVECPIDAKCPAWAVAGTATNGRSAGGCARALDRLRPGYSNALAGIRCDSPVADLDDSLDQLGRRLVVSNDREGRLDGAVDPSE